MVQIKYVKLYNDHRLTNSNIWYKQHRPHKNKSVKFFLLINRRFLLQRLLILRDRLWLLWNLLLDNAELLAFFVFHCDWPRATLNLIRALSCLHSPCFLFELLSWRPIASVVVSAFLLFTIAVMPLILIIVPVFRPILLTMVFLTILASFVTTTTSISMILVTTGLLLVYTWLFVSIVVLISIVSIVDVVKAVVVTLFLIISWIVPTVTIVKVVVCLASAIVVPMLPVTSLMPVVILALVVLLVDDVSQLLIRIIYSGLSFIIFTTSVFEFHWAIAEVKSHILCFLDTDFIRIVLTIASTSFTMIAAVTFFITPCLPLLGLLLLQFCFHFLSLVVEFSFLVTVPHEDLLLFLEINHDCLFQVKVIVWIFFWNFYVMAFFVSTFLIAHSGVSIHKVVVALEGFFLVFYHKSKAYLITTLPVTTISQKLILNVLCTKSLKLVHHFNTQFSY